MGGDVAGAREDGLDVVNLMHGRPDVPGVEVRCPELRHETRPGVARFAQGRDHVGVQPRHGCEGAGPSRGTAVRSFAGAGDGPSS